jgi:hypothetical protein
MGRLITAPGLAEARLLRGVLLLGLAGLVAAGGAVGHSVARWLLETAFTPQPGKLPWTTSWITLGGPCSWACPARRPAACDDCDGSMTEAEVTVEVSGGNPCPVVRTTTGRLRRNPSGSAGGCGVVAAVGWDGGLVERFRAGQARLEVVHVVVGGTLEEAQ